MKRKKNNKNNPMRFLEPETIGQMKREASFLEFKKNIKKLKKL
jgi:hypothetical protein|tara:strand:+ start:7914 stop:8042 length:129 start_codon:yes stop_codon:yes gene_type:complete